VASDLRWLDGWKPRDKEAFEAFSPRVAARVYAAVDWIGRHLHVEVLGVEKLPPGRAILVGNHAFGWDSIFPMAAIWRATKRPVWALGEHLWWRVPYLRRIVGAIGTVDGTRPNADRLLAADQLVLVLPGGLRESVKPRELRYRLLWGNRYGFVKAAIKNRAPLVPLVAIGPDDVFDLVGDAYARGERWLHKSFPLPRLAHVHRAHFRFVIGDPIQPSSAPDRVQDFATLRALRHEVEGAMHELIEQELARRAHLQG
jgi:1-acyl-sn-glycerol-3-phosphate acyltransferase